MRTYQIKARSGGDGTLHLQLACGLADAEIDVIVIMEPSAANGTGARLDRDEWRRFVAETAGSIQDSTFVRHPQGEYDEREPLE